MPRHVLRGRLPKPTDPGDDKVLADIREFGFHAKHVRKGAHPEHAAEAAARGPHPIYDAGLSYTVGLPYSHGHPEIAITGPLPDDRAHAILWETVHLIEGGASKSFAPIKQMMGWRRASGPSATAGARRCSRSPTGRRGGGASRRCSCSTRTAPGTSRPRRATTGRPSRCSASGQVTG